MEPDTVNTDEGKCSKYCQQYDSVGFLPRYHSIGRLFPLLSNTDRKGGFFVFQKVSR